MAVIPDTKHKTWGDVSYASGTNPTDYTYPGQYSHAAGFGLMFYKARFYSPSFQFQCLPALYSSGLFISYR